MTRANPLQLTLDEAHEERGYQAGLLALRVHEAVRPLERRRMRRLAALVALTPICRRERP